MKIKQKKIKETEKSTNEKEIELTYEELFERFVEYIQLNKIMSITQLSEQFHLSFKDILKKLRELENEGNFIVFQNDDKYFFLTQKEIYFLTKIFS